MKINFIVIPITIITFFFMKKTIEICYSKVQGKQELIQMFSKNKS